MTPIQAPVVTNEFGRSAAPGRSSVPSATFVRQSQFRRPVSGFRHYFASLLIADRLDIKTVQMRLRHASAKTTLDVYGHMWPDKDEASRAAVAAAIAARSEILADFCGLNLDRGARK